MKVLFVSNVDNLYGASRSLLSLLDGLKSIGVLTIVIIPNIGPLSIELEGKGIEYHIYPLKGWASKKKRFHRRFSRGIFNFFLSIHIAIKAKNWDIDIIHSNNSVSPIGAFIAFLLQIPHIWHVREFGREDFGLKYDLGANISYKIMAILSHQIIAISEAVNQKLIQQINPIKVITIYDAVECLKVPDNKNILEEDASSGKQLVGIFGTIQPGKGQIDAVNAIKELVKKGVKVHLAIVGEPDPDHSEYFALLKKEISDHKLDQHVSFIGFLVNPYSLMEASEIILSCSRSEAFGRVPVEGMHLNKPIIGTRSGATSELIKNGFNGLLYKPGDYHDLAEQIQYLLENPKEMERMGENGFNWAVARFSVKRHSEEILKIYKKALLNRK